MDNYVYSSSHFPSLAVVLKFYAIAGSSIIFCPPTTIDPHAEDYDCYLPPYSTI